MSMTIQERISFLEEQKAGYLAETPVNQNKVDALQKEIEKLQADLEQQQVEQVERAQRKQETIETTTSVDILAQIFDTLLPADKYEAILGPNRYDVMSQDFKQVIQVYVTDTVLAPVYAQHEMEIAQKDDRIRLLNDQSHSVQKQLDEANRTIQGLKEDAIAEKENLNDIIDEMKKELAQVKKERDDSIQENVKAGMRVQELENQTVELQSKLETTLQPKQEAQPSKKLDDMLNAIKSKNDLTADDLLSRWNARQKSDEVKIAMPKVQEPEISGYPFRGQDSENPQTDAGDSQSVAAGDENINGGQFPTLPTPAVPAIQTGSVHREVAPKTMEERVEALERAVFGQKVDVA